jgi:citrate synthase
MPTDSLTVTDNRTGRTYELPITDGTIRAMDIRAIKVDEDDFGLMSYDPAFKNTASTKSTITYIDGDKGILRYRGYPIQQLADNCTFLEVAYLIITGKLPSQEELDEYEGFIKLHTLVHENTKQLIDGFRYDAHPMGMLISTVAALSTFYPEAKQVNDPDNRRLQMTRLTAKMPTLAAFAFRHAKGYPYAYPDSGLSYAGNFLNMMFRRAEPKFEPNPVLERALDVLFILHADHEQNCGTNAMRSVGSSRVDPYSAAASGRLVMCAKFRHISNE